MTYVALPTISECSGISRRTLEIACSRIITGTASTWRGAKLVVRQGRSANGGGRSGLRYEILDSSLPDDLQQRLKDHLSTVEGPLFQAADDLNSTKHNWMLLAIEPALSCPHRSPERRAAIEKIASQRHIDWNNQPRTFCVRTIERWLERYDDIGAAAFVKKSRSDRNTARVAVSAAWDSATNLDPIIRSQIADELRRFIRGLIIKDSRRAFILRVAANRLRELTIGASDAARSLPPETFNIPRRFIDQNLRYRKVAIFDRNRKAHEDAKPRIIRSRDGLQPQEIIVGDVHHLDIVMRRPDGSEAWPRAIAWLDLATNRISIDIVLLEKGEGVRNIDVINSFIRMVDAWGMPQTLYLDNGSEYRWAEFVNDALKLIANINYQTTHRNSQIVRAKPYNAAAKAIEGIFGLLEQSYFRTIPGWAGGDRTNKRTHKVGKPTEPFPGTINDLAQLIGIHITAYETTPQRGSLDGISPRKKLENAINSGWQRIAIDRRELHTVFATNESRTPRQGHISFDGDKWTCPELQRFQGNKVNVRVPKFSNPSMLPLLDPLTQKIIGYAERAKRYGILDPVGARVAAKMDLENRDGINELRETAADVDPNLEVTRLVSALPPAQSAPIAGKISISDEAAEIASGMAETPEDREDNRQKKLRRDRLRRLEDYRRIESNKNAK